MAQHSTTRESDVDNNNRRRIIPPTLALVGRALAYSSSTQSSVERRPSWKCEQCICPASDRISVVSSLTEFATIVSTVRPHGHPRQSSVSASQYCIRRGSCTSAFTSRTHPTRPRQTTRHLATRGMSHRPRTARSDDPTSPVSSKTVGVPDEPPTYN